MLFENQGSSEDHFENVRQLIEAIKSEASDGDYVFRGEAKQYPEVCSGLYRELRDAVRLGLEIDGPAKSDLDDAKFYTGQDDDLKVLSHLQHYGGITNLVDFTTDVRVALFFACDGHPRESGRVIILEHADSDSLTFHQPTEPEDCAPAQRSVLVQPLRGVVEGGHEIVVPSNLKRRALEYLSECQSMSHRSVYSGYHGFIKLRQRRWETFALVDKGLKHLNEKEFEAAAQQLGAAIDDLEILHTFKALDISWGLAQAYNYRGMAYQSLCKANLASADFSAAEKLVPNTPLRLLSEIL